MTLQRKTTLTSTCVLVTAFLVVYTVTQKILDKGFTNLEHKDVQQRIERANAALAEQVNTLDTLCSDWANWDDSYEYAATKNEDFAKATLQVDSFVSAKLDIIAILDTRQAVLFAQEVDLKTERASECPAELLQHMRSGPLNRGDQPDSTVKGLLLLPKGALLVAARPILRTDQTGPSRGTMLMGRYLNDARIEQMENVLLQKPVFERICQSSLPDDFRAAHALLAAGRQLFTSQSSDEVIAAYTLVRDLYDQPVMIMRLETPRSIHLHGDLTIRLLLIALLATGLVMGAVMLYLLHTQVLSRVALLNRTTIHIANSGDPSLRVPAAGHDELATLGTSINSMLESLEISERRLRAAKESAEEANSLKSRFLATISHEVRSPLNCILGYSETILREHHIEAIHQQTRTILEEAETMLAIINDLLDSAKIEAGKMILDPRPINLRTLLAGVLRSARIQVRSKSIEIHTQFANDLPVWIVGDSLRLRQILMNFVSNAIKFTERGSVTIVCRAIHLPAASLRFEVIDTGIGISREQQAGIFKSYTQADASVARKYGGTGLGTSIAYQLTQMMNGQIGFESEAGKGSTFWFTIPLKTASLPDESPAETADDKSTSLRRITGRILVVDDYPSNREIARLHLQGAGHSVTEAENGEQAVAACQKATYDLILMDDQMPHMSGQEAARLIRGAKNACADVPIIALTGESRMVAREELMKVGVDDILLKPIRRNQLLTCVDHWLTIGRKAGAVLKITAASSGADPFADIPLFQYETAVREFGNPDTVTRVARTFCDIVESQIPSMVTAIENRNLESLRCESHKIKGGAGTLTAARLAEAARLLETCCEQHNLEQLTAAMNELIAEFSRFKEYVQEHIQSIPGRR